VSLIYIPIPGDSCISLYYTEKHTKYIDLKIEVVCMRNSKKVAVVPIIVGALGSIPVSISTRGIKTNKVC